MAEDVANTGASARITGSGMAAARRHARRYLPFYVFGVVLALVVGLLPTVAPVQDAGRPLDVGGPDGPGGGGWDGDDSGQIVAGERGDVAGDGAPRSEPDRRSEGTAPSGPGEAAPGPDDGAAPGTTRGGFECAPGVRQLPWSDYAAPCLPAFEGENPGATWNGVTEDTVRIVLREYAIGADQEALDVLAQQQGLASTEEERRTQQVFIDYFNEVFELYGRRVEILEFRTNANPFDEANGRGRERACAEATHIAEELRAFAVMPASGLGFGPFSECAAERGLVQPVSAYGFPQEWYDRYAPFVFGIQMNCTRIAHHYVEYVAKRLNGGNAVRARDALYQQQERRFGSITPDIEAYGPCQDLADRLFRESGVDIASEYRYVLDPATLPAQMDQAVVRFRADGITTLLLAADFLTMINLTQAASRQNWGPEWILLGAGQQDVDNWARLYQQGVVDGHMFGVSQLGDTTEILQGESAETYRRATGEEKHPGATGGYFNWVHVFNLLQAAGPNLTPETVAGGAMQLPVAGGADAAMGTWSFRERADGQRGLEGTAVIDAREVYWDGNATSPTGQTGMFVPTSDGRRFGMGEWPGGEPDVYPDR